MKLLFPFLFIFLICFSNGVWAECPYSIKDATVMLSLPNEIKLKFTSSSMCNQKDYFADRFLDADVELYKADKLVGKFYARRVTYEVNNLKIILQNAVLLKSDVIKDKKFKDISFAFIDLKNSKISTQAGEIHF